MSKVVSVTQVVVVSCRPKRGKLAGLLAAVRATRLRGPKVQAGTGRRAMYPLPANAYSTPTIYRALAFSHA
jgi:hypothetical protein